MRPHFTTPCKRCGEPKNAHASTCRYIHNKQPIEIRFWDRVSKPNPDACWEWMGARDSNGYGNIWYQGRTQKTSRVAYELTHGVIDPALDVCHTCDNPPCCNPKHLFEGTRAENQQDMTHKRRNGMATHPENAPKGERNRHACLTEQDIQHIRQQRAEGIGTRQLARAYNVDRTTIQRIVSRKIWKHIN